MERKINSYLEFSGKDYSHFKRNSNSSDLSSCNFLSCDVLTCSYEYPLKIMIPHLLSDTTCQWVYLIIFGSGLVEGDNLSIYVKLKEKCCVLLTTLSFSKVYSCKNGMNIQQQMNCKVQNESLLCIIPDPVVCYKNASYIQTQDIYLTTNANLVLLDWFLSGRYACGERWAFSRLKSSTTIFINEKPAFKDTQDLKNTPFVTLEKAMKSYNVIGLCMIIGNLVKNLLSKILLEMQKCEKYGEKSQSDLLFAVSPLYLENVIEVGAIVKFAAENVSEAKNKLEFLLRPLFDLFGDNPFRK